MSSTTTTTGTDTDTGTETNANTTADTIVNRITQEERQSLNLGSCLFGIPIRAHYTYFILLVVEVLSSLRYGSVSILLFVFLLYGPILLATIIVHELGHVLMTLRLGGEVGGIILWPLGGFALCGPTEKGILGDLQVALAGVLTHIPQSLLWLTLYAILSKFDFSEFSWAVYRDQLDGGIISFTLEVCQHSVWMNLFLLAFNLLIPAYPLDGGRCLAACLLLCGCSIEMSAIVTSVTAMVLAGGMVLIGAWSYLVAGNPSAVFTVLVGLYIFSRSWNLYRLTKDGRVKEDPLFGRACFEKDRGCDVQPAEGEVV